MPLGLPWGKKLDHNFQKYKDYRYIYGDIEWGQMVFSGYIQDTLRSELVLKFTNNSISSAYLIFGPDGLNERNCLFQYRKIVKALSEKYGQQKYREVVRESIMEDLVFVSECYAIGVGVAEIVTRWKIKNFQIEAVVFSDEGTIFIEIEYIYLPLLNAEKSDLLKYL